MLPETLANSQFPATKDFAVFLRMGRDTYKRAGLVMASSRTVRCSPAGLIAEEIRTFVSITRRRGSIYRFGFWDREDLMIWSIWREVNVLVPFRSDSSPMTLRTSGSGAASLT